MSRQNSVLFFLHKYNEVDQVSPIIWKIGQRQNICVDVVLLNNISQDDYRISTLKAYKNVSIYDGESNSNTTRDIRNKFVDYAKRKSKKIPTKIPEYIYKEYVWSKNSIIPEGLDYEQYSAIAFDWSLAKHHKTNAFTDENDITTLVLPHGDSPYRNHIIDEGKFQTLINQCNDSSQKKELANVGYQSWEKMLLYDYLLLPNEQTASRIRNRSDCDQIKILGSPRYNWEWLDVLSNIRPVGTVDETDDLAVVFFLRKKNFFISKEEVKYTISLLDKIPGVQTIVKEHPVSRLLDPSIEDEFNTVKIIKDEIKSASLIMWGDVFLSLGTTISFEPIMRKKPVLALEYTHGNQSVVSQYFPSADMRCKDDFYNAIYDLLNKPTKNFYNDDEHRKFVEEMVTNSNDSVLDSWARFIEGVTLN